MEINIKETVTVIESDLPFKGLQAWITAVPCKPFVI